MEPWLAGKMRAAELRRQAEPKRGPKAGASSQGGMGMKVALAVETARS